MSAYERLQARLDEATSCMECVSEIAVARQILSARRAALAEALIEIEAEWQEAEAAEDEAEPTDAEPPPAEAEAQAKPKPKPQPRPEPTTDGAGRAERAGAKDSPYTPERCALIRDLWHDTKLTMAEIYRRVSALPGPPIASQGAMAQHAYKKLRLPTSRGVTGFNIPPRVRELAGAVPDGSALQGLSDEELTDARHLIVVRQRGAKDLVAEFGWDLPRAQAVAAALREAAKTEAQQGSAAA